MAWHHARYINKIIEEGKAEYPIPMFVNAWLQQSNMAWPGTYPSGGPLPQVHDVWQAGAPASDLSRRTLYIQQFEETCQRWTCDGNPLFIPETSANAANAFMAFTKYNAFGYSPFGIERSVGPDNCSGRRLSASWRHGARDPVEPGQGHHDPGTNETGRSPAEDRARGYTLELSYLGAGRAPIAPTAGSAGGPGGTTSTGCGARPGAQSPNQAAAGPGAGSQRASTEVLADLHRQWAGSSSYMGGTSGLRITFTPNTPGPPVAGLGDVQVGRFVNGTWTVVRQLGGDDTGAGRILSLRPNTVLRVTVYRRQIAQQTE